MTPADRAADPAGAVTDLAPARRRVLRTRRAILDAAADLYDQRGPRAVTIADICASADVAERTFFNHFATRDELDGALAQERARAVADLVDEVTASDQPLARRLDLLFAGVAAGLGDRPTAKELFADLSHTRHDRSNETARNRLIGASAVRFVEDGVRRGEVTVDVAAPVLADLLVGALVTAAANWSVDDAYDLAAELADTAAALTLLFTIEPRPARKRSR